MSHSTKKPSGKIKSKKSKRRRPLRKPAVPNIVTTSPSFDPVGGQFDGEASVIPITPSNVASAILYLNAHHLIPYDYDFDPIRDRGRVEVAAATFEKTDASEAELLHAIAILGHSPCDTALRTLNRWTDSDHHYASVARFALSECQALTN